jgi:hypothetical protein
MNPNQDQNGFDPNWNTAVGASEYLDQISAKPKSGFNFLDKKMMIILGGVVAVILIVIVVIASSSGKKTVDISAVLSQASAQYVDAMQVIQYGVDNLDSSSLARNNAIASLVVGSHKTELVTKIGKGGISTRDPKVAQGELKLAKEAGRLESKYRETTGLFLQDIIDTLSMISATKDVAQSDREMAAQYIEELETIKSRIEGI